MAFTYTVSSDAWEWCWHQGIALYALGLHQDMPVLNLVPEGPRDANGTHGLGRVALRRAQYAADPVRMAQAMVAEKIRRSAWVGGWGEDAPGDNIASGQRVGRFLRQLDQTRTVAGVRTVEGHAAKDYFQGLAQVIGEIAWSQEQGGTTIPENWRTWNGSRLSALSGKNRRAVHPVNSLLNFGYAAIAAQLTRALAMEGFDVYAGYLHADSEYRAGLAWDAAELVRHRVDAGVVCWLRARTWRRSDFVIGADGGVFLGKGLRPAAVERMALADAEVRDVLRWLRGVLTEF